MFRSTNLLLLSINSFYLIYCQQQNENDQCLTSNGVIGKCIRIASWPPTSSSCPIQDDNPPTFCKWDRKNLIICCPSNDRVDGSSNKSTTDTVIPMASGQRQISCGVMKDILTDDSFDRPWVAALFTKHETDGSLLNRYDHFCGGSIISENAILTAAHCVSPFMDDRLSELFVGVGSTDLNDTIKLPINKIIVHPNYGQAKNYYDIALVFTSTPIDFNHKVKPICLPESSIIDSNKSKLVYALGWGWIAKDNKQTNHLRIAKLELVSNQQCNRVYSKFVSSLKEGIRNDQICAQPMDGGIDVCSGFGGGPLTTQLARPESYEIIHYQIGIVSFGRGCNIPEYPGVYTKVTEYVPWIEKELPARRIY